MIGVVGNPIYKIINRKHGSKEKSEESCAEAPQGSAEAKEGSPPPQIASNLPRRSRRGRFF